MVEANGLHSHVLHFHVNKLILFVHTVNAADVLLLPRNSQVEPFIAELDLRNGSSCAALDWSFECDCLLLRPNIVDYHCSVSKAHSKHKAIWVELNCCNCYLSLHFQEQLAALDIVQRPGAVIRTHDNVVTNGVMAEASNILVAFDFVKHFA